MLDENIIYSTTNIFSLAFVSLFVKLILFFAKPRKQNKIMMDALPKKLGKGIAQKKVMCQVHLQKFLEKVGKFRNSETT